MTKEDAVKAYQQASVDCEAARDALSEASRRKSQAILDYHGVTPERVLVDPRTKRRYRNVYARSGSTLTGPNWMGYLIRKDGSVSDVAVWVFRGEWEDNQ